MSEIRSVMFAIPSLEVGGAERQLVALAVALQKQGIRVSVVTFSSGGPLQAGLSDAGVRYYAIGKNGLSQTFGLVAKLAGLVRSERPDILYSFLVTANIAAAFVRPLVRNVRVIWGVRASNLDMQHYGRKEAIACRLESWLSSCPDLIISNSKAGAADHIAQGFPRERVCVVPNGIDTERFRPSPDAREAVRRQWGIDSSDVLIGLSGRLDPMKDHLTFLRAAALLAPMMPQVRFVCIGDGPAPYRDQLHQLASTLGLDDRLVWAGVRHDMRDVYSALDVAVSSSAFGEGFPNVVGEAMACGVPCVVTDVGDSAEVVGETGIVVEQSNPQLLSNALAEMAGRVLRSAGEMGAAARRRIEDEFSIQALVVRTLAALART